jgi:hypothetical protein
MEREKLGVQGHAAARVALAGTADVVERGSDGARDRLDGEGEPVLVGEVEQSRQTIEVAIEVPVAVGKLPEVEDDDPGAETTGDPAVEREAVEVGVVARERGPGPFVGVGGDERQPTGGRRRRARPRWSRSTPRARSPGCARGCGDDR